MPAEKRERPVNPDKQNSRDFALWKRKDEDGHTWESQYGIGRPGWDVECAAIINKTIGREVDLHIGGIDLKNRHHENELALMQAHSDGGVRMFLHIGHLQVSLSSTSSRPITATRFGLCVLYTIGDCR